MPLTALLVIAALIFVNAVYVAAEFAAVSVRRSRIRQLAASGNRLATWLLPVLTSPNTLDRYIAACQIGITISSLVLGAYAQLTFAVWLAPVLEGTLCIQEPTSRTAATVAVLVPTLLGCSSGGGSDRSARRRPTTTTTLPWRRKSHSSNACFTAVPLMILCDLIEW